MAYNREHAAATAFQALAALAQRLRDAVRNGQEFEVEQHAGMTEPPGPGGHAARTPDGSYELRVTIKPRATVGG